MKPTVGRIVLYTLSAADAEKINRRRTTGQAIAERIVNEKWPLGAQAHIGNEACKGQILPMMVVHADETDFVNGQVFLDGNDVLWVQSAPIGPSEAPIQGFWHWPPRTVAP